MSIEQLLFIVLLIVVPLLERLMRALRARSDDPAGDRPPSPARKPVPRPPAPVRPPGARDTPLQQRGVELPLPTPPLPVPPVPVPPLPRARPQATPHAAPEHLRAPEREPRARREPGQVQAAKGRGSRPERPPALRRVIASGDLRRAIVLMTVLGPCRALEPKDASGPGSLR